jgi:hypothetical protein
MDRFKFLQAAALVTSALLLSPLAFATDDLSEISSQSFNNIQGVASINEAAGEGNQQVNLRALAINPQGVAEAQAAATQIQGGKYRSEPGKQKVVIQGNSFTSLSGIVGINQASGTANTQANAVTIAIGIGGETVADSLLAGASSNRAGLVNRSRQSQPGSRVIGVDDTAFQGARGIVQLNQTGGAGNLSSNNFALRVAEPKL